MKRIVLPFLLSSLAVGAACKKDESKPADTASSAPADTASSAPADTARGGGMVSGGDSKPQAIIYSEEAGKALLDEMAKCENPYTCDPLETLIGFGDKVSGDLAEVANNGSNTPAVRKVALEALKKIKDPAVGLGLFETAKTEEEFMVRRELFAAAGASGGDEAFGAMIAHYASDDSKEHRTDMRSGIRAFGGEMIFAWAAENYPEDEDSEIRFADLISDAGEAADKATVVELIAKSKDIMARHRLAKVAVQLGDTEQLSVLIDGLKSKDQYDRSDAANFLQDVAEKIPAERKQEVIDLVTAAKAKDAGGLTARGYNKVLKKLGAE